MSNFPLRISVDEGSGGVASEDLVLCGDRVDPGILYEDLNGNRGSTTLSIGAVSEGSERQNPGYRQGFVGVVDCLSLSLFYCLTQFHAKLSGSQVSPFYCWFLSLFLL